MRGNEAWELRAHIGNRRSGFPSSRWKYLQPEGGTRSPILPSELHTDRMVMAKMATRFMVLGLNPDRRVRQVPVQQRDDSTHRYHPDRQNGDSPIAYAPSRPQHIGTLGGDETGVNR